MRTSLIFPPKLWFSPSLGCLGNVSHPSHASRKEQEKWWGLEGTLRSPRLTGVQTNAAKAKEMFPSETSPHAGPGWGIRRNVLCCLPWPGRTGCCNSSILGSEGRDLGMSLPLSGPEETNLSANAVPLTSLLLVFIRTLHFIPLQAREWVLLKGGPSRKCSPWVSQCLEENQG